MGSPIPFSKKRLRIIGLWHRSFRSAGTLISQWYFNPSVDAEDVIAFGKSALVVVRVWHASLCRSGTLPGWVGDSLEALRALQFQPHAASDGPRGEDQSG